MSASTQQRYGLPLVARVSIVAAFLEAFTWAGLLAGMFLKYVTGTTDVGVSIFGALHGGMFLIYLAIALITAITLRWPWRVTALSMALLQRLAAVRGRLSLCADQAAAAKW
ncbi:MAG: DUF3817 domain-containing protein, partial [Dietzia maris]